VKKLKNEGMNHIRIFVAKPSTIKLDSTSQIFIDILSTIEAESSSQFSLCGGFVRNLMLGKGYNDFDICTPNVYRYRTILNKMGVLRYQDENPVNNVVKAHDYFINPYDISGTGYPVHWIDHDDVHGYPPSNFDFSINEFALKSDGMIHAPTYAWRHFHSKILRMNPNINVTTNLLMRAIRFSCLTGFTLDKQSIRRMQERFVRGNLDKFRISMGIKKMRDDGVADQSFTLMNELGFTDITDFDDIFKLYDDCLRAVESGIYNYEEGDYHNFDEIQPPATTRAFPVPLTITVDLPGVDDLPF
jgi:hypothetical protein